MALAAAASADTPLRIATFNTELGRKGPGLLLRDITSGKDRQVAAVASVIARNRPDILALQGIDWDLDNTALIALQKVLADAGHDMPFAFAKRPNSGLRTGLDMNGDGYTGDPEDAQSFGRFTGSNGIAVLSRFPIRRDQVVDLSDLLWAEVDGAVLPRHEDGSPFPTSEAVAIQRLSSTAHWIVPIDVPGDLTVSLLTYQAGPPVFDGPEDRNGLRNRDENRLWQLVLDGVYGPVPGLPVIAGGANLDPEDGEGRHAAIKSLLTDDRLQDPFPKSPGAKAALEEGHAGDSALDTVDWPRVGRLRVDYVLPGARWRVSTAGVDWPADPDGRTIVETASRHRLVWVDLLPPLQ